MYIPIKPIMLYNVRIINILKNAIKGYMGYFVMSNLLPSIKKLQTNYFIILSVFTDSNRDRLYRLGVGIYRYRIEPCKKNHL